MPDAAPKAPLSLGRKIAATIGILVMVLAGGCTAVFIASTLPAPSGPGAEVTGLALFVGGVPFAIGLLIFLIAFFGGRKATPNGRPAATPGKAGEYNVGDLAVTDPATKIAGQRQWKGRPVHELADGTLEAFIDGGWQRFKDWNELQITIN